MFEFSKLADLINDTLFIKSISRNISNAACKKVQYTDIPNGYYFQVISDGLQTSNCPNVVGEGAIQGRQHTRHAATGIRTPLGIKILTDTHYAITFQNF